jgi:hypothetical protein
MACVRYLRKWGERLTVGAQFMAHTSDQPQPGVPSIAPMVSLVTRWREKQWVATLSGGPMDGSVHASYYHFIPPIQGSGTVCAPNNTHALAHARTHHVRSLAR